MQEFFGVETLDQEFPVSPRDYFATKKEFEDKILFGTWNSMFDLLVSYNLNDVVILYKAMENFCKMVKIAFDTEVLSKISLPGLAEGMFIFIFSSHIYEFLRNHVEQL